MSHPKFYFFDTGVYRAIRPSGPFDSPAEIDGAALETLIMQELRGCIDAFGLSLDLYFWRTTAGSEVDFVLYGADGFHAIEIKRKRRISGHDLRGLRAFLSDYPEATAAVFYGGDRMEYREGITLYPISEAVLRLPQILKP